MRLARPLRGRCVSWAHYGSGVVWAVIRNRNPMTRDVWPILTATTRAIDRLDGVVVEVNRRLPQPVLKDDWFQYRKEDQDARVVALTRMARIVSGLRAVKQLGERGYLEEMGVLLRTIDDFCDEVTFLIEGHDEGKPGNQAQRFIDHFFAETLISHGPSSGQVQGPDRVKRNKIRAGQSRFLQPENPSDVRIKVAKVDKAFDSYVHGGYPAVMELYEGKSGSFSMTGVSGSPNVAAMRRQLAYYVSRALSVTGFACYAMGFGDLGDQMKAANKEFCESAEYPAGEA